MPATKPHTPWHLAWYCAFQTEREAKDFELYLKSGSGKAFAYKRLVSVALKKDLTTGRIGNPNPSEVYPAGQHTVFLFFTVILPLVIIFT